MSYLKSIICNDLNNSSSGVRTFPSSSNLNVLHKTKREYTLSNSFSIVFLEASFTNDQGCMEPPSTDHFLRPCSKISPIFLLNSPRTKSRMRSSIESSPAGEYNLPFRSSISATNRLGNHPN